MSCLLEIRDLNISFIEDKTRVDAVTGFNLELKPGEIVALVGESGSGKTTTALSIMKLLESRGKIKQTGDVVFDGKKLKELTDKKMRSIRGGDIGMVFQEPLSALNPAMGIGVQIEEVLLLHGWKDAAERKHRVLEVMQEVGLPNPERLYPLLPQELSGGMKQRVVIAMAIACRPKLILADEPTTALDVTIQAQILKLLKSLKEQYGLSIIIITHDLGVVAEIADRVVVMYGGYILESAPVSELFEVPRHPYTKGLMKCIPYVGQKQETLYTIPGSVPRACRLEQGCVFYSRCPYAEKRCREEILELKQVNEQHCTRCLRWGEVSNA